ncbi:MULTISPECIES: CNNM domain-containing protein [Marinobacter]|uniref:CNNM domain-containing protein n=1 Tax=Marinobacter TaxID=2742 RepID=UPI000DAD50BB|nr:MULTISPECIES: CNNM domain-containing protein [Marinobacter]
MLLLITFAAISIGFSFLCSILEAALLSVTPSYIASLKQDRPELFARLRKLKDNIDDPLAAILTLNTVAHTVGATGVGAQVTVVFGDAWVGVASGVMTLAILILSEIIPKTIGAKFWRSLAPWLPSVLRCIMVPLAPFIWLSNQITRRIGANEPDVDLRGEISALTEIGRDQNALDEDERRVIQNILQLHEITIGSIMTPRTVCQTVRPDASVDEFRERFQELPFTRYPLIDEDGRSHGYVHKPDLLNAEGDARLDSVAREMTIVRAGGNIEHLFALMLRERQHMAVVYDEMDTWVGVVTMEDILETILGLEIMDETDNVANLRRYAKERWSRRLRKLSAQHL